MSISKSSQAKPRLRYTLAAAAVGTAVLAAPAAAQTSFGSGTQIVIPTVANLSVYTTQVFVRNPNAGQITLNVNYYQSNDGTPPTGLRSCGQVVLDAGVSSSFDLGTQCSLNNTDNNFGMLIIDDQAGT